MSGDAADYSAEGLGAPCSVAGCTILLEEIWFVSSSRMRQTISYRLVFAGNKLDFDEFSP